MIFVSYSWINEEPDENVLKLVAELRNDGYNAICDVMLVQKESSIHFTKMMAECLKDADKVLIVLSKKYKEKADSFQGGVGDEYQYVIEDIKNNRQKYILVTFDEDRNSVSPDFLHGREIISLNKHYPSQNDTLLHRINETDQYIFPPVSDAKKYPSTKNINISNPPNPQVYPLLKRADQLIREHKTYEAKQVLEKIINSIDPENALAWWLLLTIEYKISNENYLRHIYDDIFRSKSTVDDYISAIKNNKNYVYAMQYSNPDEKSRFNTEFSNFENRLTYLENQKYKQYQNLERGNWCDLLGYWKSIDKKLNLPVYMMILEHKNMYYLIHSSVIEFLSKIETNYSAWKICYYRGYLYVGKMHFYLKSNYSLFWSAEYQKIGTGYIDVKADFNFFLDNEFSFNKEFYGSNVKIESISSNALTILDQDWLKVSENNFPKTFKAFKLFDKVGFNVVSSKGSSSSP